MKYIIASDFHLKYTENEEDKQRRERVEGFLSSLVGKIDGLILAGDIFDLWVEWDKVIIKSYFNVLKIFSLLKESGCRMIYLSGNHDFWFGEFLQKNIGFEMYEKTFSEVINGKRVLVSHGDLFAINDLRYQIVRPIIRSLIAQKIFRAIHPDCSLSLGQKLSRTSRERKINVKAKNMQVSSLVKTAEKLSKEYDLIVFGHSHVPQKREIGNSVYVNCGDWVEHNSYCYFDTESIELKKYE